MNAWTEADASISHAVDGVAQATGGRSYRGIDDLESNVRRAADAHFGRYIVGYYRSDPSSAPRDVRVELDREDVVVSWSEADEDDGAGPEPVRLDLALARPRSNGRGDDQVVPVRMILPIDALPFRGTDAGRATVLSMYLEATRPDGTVVADRLDVQAVTIPDERAQDPAGKYVFHETELVLPPGPHRIHGRVSDDRRTILADRSIDVTISREQLAAGFEPALPPGTSEPR
jgi:hypothetical protein